MRRLVNNALVHLFDYLGLDIRSLQISRHAASNNITGKHTIDDAAWAKLHSPPRKQSLPDPEINPGCPESECDTLLQAVYSERQDIVEEARRWKKTSPPGAWIINECGDQAEALIKHYQGLPIQYKYWNFLHFAGCKTRPFGLPRRMHQAVYVQPETTVVRRLGVVGFIVDPFKPYGTNPTNVRVWTYQEFRRAFPQAMIKYWLFLRFDNDPNFNPDSLPER